MKENASSDILIYESKLPPRAENILQCMGLSYLSELQLFTESQLFEVKGLGNKLIKWDIIPALNDRGMSLCDEDRQQNEDKMKADSIVDKYNNRCASHSMNQMKVLEIKKRMTPAAWGLISQMESARAKADQCKKDLGLMGINPGDLSLLRMAF